MSDVQLRKSDFGLNTVLTNIPNVAHALSGALSVPIDINSIDISLNGTVGGQGFMRNPTSCGTKTTKFTADSYANPNQKITGPGDVQVDQLRRAAVLADVHGRRWARRPHGSRSQSRR